jgi:hypothetical protein
MKHTIPTEYFDVYQFAKLLNNKGYSIIDAKIALQE